MWLLLLGSPLDSIFTPLLYANPRLSLPARDRLEEAAAGEMVAALEDAAQVWLESLDGAISARDIAAVGESSWAAKIPLEFAIFQTWAAGFELGGADGIAEMVDGVGPILSSGGPFRFQFQSEALEILNLEPVPLINTSAVDAVRARANLLAGNFAADIFDILRGHVIAAIVPQADTGEPIDRPTLLQRIMETLGVGGARAQNIARTELTYAYNDGRMASFSQSTLVDYYRVIAIDDGRTTEICRSRNGLVLTREQLDSIGGVPPYHYQCRTTVSPVMSRLRRGRALVDDPENQLGNREVAPLLAGWNGQTQNQTPPQNPRPTPPINLREIESEIIDQEFETAVAIRDGRIVLRKDGGVDSVAFSDQEMTDMRGAVLTHNHPLNPDQARKGSGFSEADIFLSIQNGLEEIRAVSGNYEYSFRPSNNENLTLQEQVILKTSYLKIQEEEVAKERAWLQRQDPAVRRSKISDVNFRIWHNISRRFASENGMEYQRTRR